MKKALFLFHCILFHIDQHHSDTFKLEAYLLLTASLVTCYCHCLNTLFNKTNRVLTGKSFCRFNLLLPLFLIAVSREKLHLKRKCKTNPSWILNYPFVLQKQAKFLVITVELSDSVMFSEQLFKVPSMCFI